MAMLFSIRGDVMKHIELYATQISQGQAAQIAPLLVSRSQWFSIEPLPDDLYELQVKAENQNLVTSLLFNLGERRDLSDHQFYYNA